MKTGLLGRKLGHSYSPQIHALLGNDNYQLFEREPEDIGDFLKTGDFHGINVTIPYKKAVIPYLDELTPKARTLNAVNTLIRRPDGTLLGHNTDHFGFHTMVSKSGVDPAGKKVLILGSGGASATAAAVLKELGADGVVISRTGENNYGNLTLHLDASVIVNTTPVGMYPDTGCSPLDLRLFPRLEAVLDVIYNPARTQLLLDAEALGIPCIGGLWMLVAQAKEAWEWFSGTIVPESEIDRIHAILTARMENIILIGMPGCGKTSVAAALSQRLDRPWVDGDTELEKQAHTSIPEIFAKEGETGFRQRETRILAQLGKQSGMILATGGGCVTQERNYPLLHQNGRIFWLQRDIHTLPREGRPLSLAGDLQQMYAARAPLYETFCDHIIENDGTPEDAAGKIIAILEGIS